jgi:biopolymer transport protein ExbD
VNKDDVVVQGETVARVADIMASSTDDIEPIMAQLTSLQNRVIGVRTQTVAASKEVTILADKSIPFDVVRRVMASCTATGYERISLAVIQKETGTQI